MYQIKHSCDSPHISIPNLGCAPLLGVGNPKHKHEKSFIMGEVNLITPICYTPQTLFNLAVNQQLTNHSPCSSLSNQEGIERACHSTAWHHSTMVVAEITVRVSSQLAAGTVLWGKEKLLSISLYGTALRGSMHSLA
jgi:hypothetical protein